MYLGFPKTAASAPKQLKGFEKVTLMLKTKSHVAGEDGSHFAVCHSLYTADDITPTEPGV